MAHCVADLGNITSVRMTKMNQNEQVIFAELRRSDFEIIVSILSARFRRMIWGPQGDDWIWIFSKGYKLEIDSFYSLHLDVRGLRRSYGLVRKILCSLPPSTIIKEFEILKRDLTAPDH